MHSFLARTLMPCALIISTLSLFLLTGPALAPAFAAGTLTVAPKYDKAALAPDVAAEVNVLVTITAPTVTRTEKRPPVAVSLVLDRSGSMDEAGKMNYAIAAGKTLVRSLEPEDLFALTIYDSEVDVLYPLGKVTDKQKVIRMLDRITPRSMTFLSGGLEEGVNQLRSVRNEGPCRVILLSDGLANRGVTGAEQVGALGAKARNQGIGVTTIGLGLDFNEDLMQLLAQRGGGQYYYIKDSEDLPAVFKQEFGLIADSFTKDLRTTFKPADGVTLAKVYGYNATKENEGTDIEMSDLSSGEERMVMLKLAVTPGAEGTQQLGVMRFGYTDQADGTPQSLEIPVSLTVLKDEKSRDEAEQREKENTTQVRDEALIMEADEARVLAVAELQKGNVQRAKSILADQKRNLAAAPENVAVVNKLEQLSMDEAAFDQAVSDANLRNSLSKASKSSAYMSSQGQKQGSMLKKGDRGFMVEKLQLALKDKGFWPGDVTGTYDPDLEEAVKRFQQSQSITPDGIAGPQTLRALEIH